MKINICLDFIAQKVFLGLICGLAFLTASKNKVNPIKKEKFSLFG